MTVNDNEIGSADMEIRLNNLIRHYEGVHAVNGVSLTVPSNKIMGIIGKSGAGKSTLVRLMSLLEKPDSGEVLYDDKRVDTLDKDDLIRQRRRIGMIFQNFNLFSSRKAGENVAYPMEIAKYPKKAINERVHEMMELVGLSDKINAPISTLSGGQKQRVSIARALSTKPEILFCDEATSALDPQTTRSILALIKDIQKKMNLTVVMITHQMEVVRDTCDFVSVLNEGVIVEKNTTKGLFANPKTEIAKDFLSNLSPTDAFKTGILLFSGRTGRYNLRFSPNSTGRPVLSSIIKKYDIDMNILGAGIQQVDNENYGNMTVDISGAESEVEKAISDLRRENIVVEDAGV